MKCCYSISTNLREHFYASRELDILSPKVDFINRIPCLKQDILPVLTNEKRIPLLHWTEIAMHAL
jgi:hypothetical protein